MGATSRQHVCELRQHVRPGRPARDYSLRDCSLEPVAYNSMTGRMYASAPVMSWTISKSVPVALAFAKRSKWVCVWFASVSVLILLSVSAATDGWNGSSSRARVCVSSHASTCCTLAGCFKCACSSGVSFRATYIKILLSDRLADRIHNRRLPINSTIISQISIISSSSSSYIHYIIFNIVVIESNRAILINIIITITSS